MDQSKAFNWYSTHSNFIPFIISWIYLKYYTKLEQFAIFIWLLALI